MSIRIGQNTASAAGASLMDMANFLRQDDQLQNKQSTDRMNLVDEMAKRLLEQEKQEKDAQAEADRIAAEKAKLDAKAASEKAGRDGVASFSRWVNENPGATFAQKNAKALELGVAGLDDSKNFLGGEMGNQRFGETVAENTRKGGRFTEQMEFRKGKAQQDYDFAEAKWRQAVDDAERAQDERERHNKAMEAARWQSIKDSKAKSLMSFSSRGGLVIDDEDEFISAAQEVEANKKTLAEMQAAQSKALPDPMLKSQYETLLRRTADIEKEIQRVTIEGFGPGAPMSQGVMQRESATTSERRPAKAPAAAPAHKPAARPAPAAKTNEAADLISIMNLQRQK